MDMLDVIDRPSAAGKNAEPLTPEIKKLTFRLGAEAAADLDWLAQQYGGVTLTEVFRRVVGTAKYLMEQQRDGDIIVLENKRTGRQRELVLK